MAELGSFDVLFTGICTALKAYSDQQPIADRFAVTPDRFRVLPADNQSAGVYLSLESLNAESKTTMGVHSIPVEYLLELIVRGQGVRDGQDYTRGSAIAGARLRHLIQQVLEALFAPASYLLGLERGLLGGKTWSIEAFKPDEIETESSVVAARMILTIDLAWTPQPIDGDVLESLHVDGGLWEQILNINP